MKRASQIERDELNGVAGCSQNQCLKRFCNSRWMLGSICFFTVLQSAVVTGLFAANISSIQRQFDISSAGAGILASAYDFGVIAIMLFVSYFGERHRPRALGLGFIILGLGAFLFSLPHFFEKYDIRARSVSQLCNGTNLAPDEGCDKQKSSMFYLFAFAQVMIAFGAAPLYIHGQLWLDENVKAEDMGVYLGLFYGCGAMGPAVGFVAGGMFLNSWVDGAAKMPADITPADNEWVGAWWKGYIIVAAFSIIGCIPFFLFTRYMPGTRQIRDDKRMAAAAGAAERKSMIQEMRKSIETRTSTSLKDVLLNDDESIHLAPKEEAMQMTMKQRLLGLKKLLVSMFKNKTYVYSCLGATCEAFPVSGLSAFLPKIVESSFGVSSSTAAFLVGATLIPGAVGGIVMGGYLVKRWNLSPKQTSRMTFIVAGIAMMTFLGFFIGCDSNQLAGVTTTFDSKITKSSFGSPPKGFAPLSFNSICNSGCGCHSLPYQPTCGADGKNYFNACYAGCRSKTKGTVEKIRLDDEYGQCGCFGDGSKIETQGAKTGYCDKKCSGLLYVFLFLLFLMMFTTFMNNVPSNIVVLRVLSVEQQSVGLGMQSVTYRLLGAIPGPLIFGVWIDSTCILWENKCGAQTNTCWEYSAPAARLALVILSCGPKILSTFFYYMSYRNFPDYLDINTEPTEEFVSIAYTKGKMSAINLLENEMADNTTIKKDKPKAKGDGERGFYNSEAYRGDDGPESNELGPNGTRNLRQETMESNASSLSMTLSLSPLAMFVKDHPDVYRASQSSKNKGRKWTNNRKK